MSRTSVVTRNKKWRTAHTSTKTGIWLMPRANLVLATGKQSLVIKKRTNNWKGADRRGMLPLWVTNGALPPVVGLIEQLISRIAQTFRLNPHRDSADSDDSQKLLTCVLITIENALNLVKDAKMWCMFRCELRMLDRAHPPDLPGQRSFPNPRVLWRRSYPGLGYEAGVNVESGCLHLEFLSNAKLA